MKPYELNKKEKNDWLLEKLNRLTHHHIEHCPLYQKYINTLTLSSKNVFNLADIPYLPARAFKEVSLRSIPKSELTTTMLSSGTSGQQSTIYLDKRTQLKQSLVLKEILSSFIDVKKAPLLVFDKESQGAYQSTFDARTAGILGFSSFASHIHYAVNEDGSLNEQVIDEFIKEYTNERFLVFGFTFMVWKYFIEYLTTRPKNKKWHNGILFHGGGWKKLENLNISNERFKMMINEYSGLNSIHNYYGMIEQTGSLFIECTHGHMHASKYSEIIIRDQYTREVLPYLETGVIQVFSSIPESYPGHAILTEDIGHINEDTLCQCGRNGTSISIDGRLTSAEIRGCSNVK